MPTHSFSSNLPSAPAKAVGGEVLVDAWYATALAPYGARGLDEAIASRFSARWARWGRRYGLLRGALWFAVSRGADRVVCPFSAPGLRVFLLLHWCLSSRMPRLYLVEFLRAEPRGGFSKVKEAVHLMLYRPLLARSLVAAQVMTRWEAQAYAQRYGLPAGRFCFIPFPMLRRPAEPLPPSPAEPSRTVLCSGRAACDWATVLEAARGASWSLTLVCSAEDRAGVDRLNHSGRARVFSEISHEAHQQLLDEAAVYALVLREQQASSGQVRLARAIESGVPVVATSVRGLDGYVEPGVTALTVPAGDALALRRAIDALLDDASLRHALRQRAHDAMRERTLEAYVAQIGLWAMAGRDQPAPPPEKGAP